MLGIVKDGDPWILGGQASIGYATRIAPGLSLDGGIARSQFSSAYIGRPVHYSELYVGLASRIFSGRVYYRPTITAAEIRCSTARLRRRATSPATGKSTRTSGTLVYLGETPVYFRDRQVDGAWAPLGGSAPMAYTSMYLGPSPGRAPYSANEKKTAVVVGISRAF